MPTRQVVFYFFIASVMADLLDIVNSQFLTNAKHFIEKKGNFCT